MREREEREDESRDREMEGVCVCDRKREGERVFVCQFRYQRERTTNMDSMEKGFQFWSKVRGTVSAYSPTGSNPGKEEVNRCKDMTRREK